MRYRAGMKYAASRLFHAVFLLFGVSVLSFLFSALAPGDYFSDLRLDPRISPDTIAGMRAQYGLDRPLPERYAAWLVSAAKGNFGYSLAYHGPVGPLLRERMLGTLLLTVTATLLAWLLAIPAGVWNATARGTWPDGAARLILAVLLAVPDLLLAIGFLVFAVETGWFPIGGMHSPGWESLNAAERVRDVAWHMAGPVAVLGIGMLPVLIRHVRASMVEVMDAPFAWNARAYGIPRARLLYRHLIPAALNPLISLFGFSLGTLLSTSLLIEVVMGWPGLGPLFLEAIMARDFGLVLGVVMMSATFLVAGNLVADLLLYRADPRIRVR
ncbi:MAG TPA: ABC transporter permease [Candidatus Acidoferrales bacterium]|nr:ABC transporter permease [Candidatus Acidoferrales bacterium]